MQLVFSYIQLKSTYERANLATETNVPQRLIKYVVRFQKKKKKFTKRPRSKTQTSRTNRAGDGLLKNIQGIEIVMRKGINKGQTRKQSKQPATTQQEYCICTCDPVHMT